MRHRIAELFGERFEVMDLDARHAEAFRKAGEIERRPIERQHVDRTRARIRCADVSELAVKNLVGSV